LLTPPRPGPETAALLTLYDFTLANKLFCHHLITLPSESKEHPAPFGAFVSFASYLYQHAYRTTRASLYSYLTLLILLILVEDRTIAKLLCDTMAPVRLCRQRAPHLPLPKSVERPYAEAIIDLLVDGVNHNLRKRLDTSFYIQNMNVLSQLLDYLAKSRTKLHYHWPELWRSLLSFVRFLDQYADDLKSLVDTTRMVHALIDLLSYALTAGEAFLPNAKDYDDLFYKLVESGEALIKLRDAYELSLSDEKSSINTLIGVSQHYHELIESHRTKREHLSPNEVTKIIQQGYETLRIESTDDMGQMERFREIDHKAELKKITRVAVGDAVTLVSKVDGER